MNRPAKGKRPAAVSRRRQVDKARPVRTRIVSWFRDATWRQWLKRLVLGGVASMVLLVLLLFIAYTAVSLPEEPEQLQTTMVLDADGNLLAELYKDENRVDVTLDEVADVMEEAVVATEDRHFYDHSGLDPIGITRALVNDVRGRELQGGSTITQQLVKNTYLDSERSLVRKAKEAILAVKVEQQLGKDEILERYLNTIYFGRGAWGVQKAAQRYFGVSAADLNIDQAALLAGLIRAPETADPEKAPEEAKRRRDLVLTAMVETKAIDETEADAATARPIIAVPRPDPDKTLTGSTAFFVAQVRQWATERFGEQMAFGGGLRIETTLRPAMQAAAEEAVFGTLDRPEDPDAALVAMDDRGAVVAMIGGKDFRQSSVNLATGNRRPQAGSTFKPFVLAAALESGIPITQAYAGPSQLDVPFDGEPDYDVENYGGESFGTIDLVDATAHSVNTVYAQLAAEVGIDNVVRRANELGIDTELASLPSTSLGSANVSPIEMLRAYMTFANRGERVEPYLVQRVTNADGDVLFEAAPERTEVYPRQYADVINHVLSEVIDRGTGRAADFGRPAAGKTGTTTANTDAWFVGYTPRIGAAVWMGYQADTTHKMNDVHGRAVTGGGFPAQIWRRFMEAATEDLDTGEFEDPPDDLLNPRPVEPPEETTTTSSTSSTVPDGSTTTTEPDGNGSTTTTTTPGGSTTVPTTSTTTPGPSG